jgi:single-stranded-DNA-specific exonuclease
LLACLVVAANLLEKFGGHEMAAGLTIREENLAVFATAFQENCRALLSAEQLEPVSLSG